MSLKSRVRVNSLFNYLFHSVYILNTLIMYFILFALLISFRHEWEASKELFARKSPSLQKLIWCNEILNKQGSKTLLGEVLDRLLSKVYTRTSCFKQVWRYRRVLECRKELEKKRRTDLLHLETVVIESFDWIQLFFKKYNTWDKFQLYITMTSTQNH